MFLVLIGQSYVFTKDNLLDMFYICICSLFFLVSGHWFVDKREKIVSQEIWEFSLLDAMLRYVKINLDLDFHVNLTFFVQSVVQIHKSLIQKKREFFSSFKLLALILQLVLGILTWILLFVVYLANYKYWMPYNSAIPLTRFPVFPYL